MDETSLKKAIVLARAGDKAAARQILAGLVVKEPKNELAWLWMAYCANTIDGKRYALERALEINPKNKKAQGELNRTKKEALEAKTEKMDRPEPPAPTRQVERVYIEQAQPQPKKKKKRGCASSLGLIVLLCIVLAFIGSLSRSNDSDTPKGTKAPTAIKEPSNMEAWSICKEYVKTYLKAPATAKFPSYYDATIWKDGDNWRVSATVDAENTFGANIQSYFICVISHDGKKWHLEDMEIG